MSETDMIQVEVAYALPDRQAIIPVNVAAGTTALEAARRSGVAQRFEGLNLEDSRLGIFGKLVAPDQVLQAGDRVGLITPTTPAAVVVSFAACGRRC